MVASAQLDGRIDWNSTRAALVAAFPNPAFPNGTTAPTTDQGLQSWNSVLAAWQGVGVGIGNYGYNDTPVYQWRPVSSAAAVTFTAVITAGSTTATLNGNWAGASGLFPLTLSTGQVVNALLANGATSCTFYAFPTPATGLTYGPAFAVNAATANATVAGQGPVVGVANLYSVSASVSLGVAAVLTGSVPDVPRNVVGAWTNTAIVTVVGTDFYGRVQTEVSASGTALATKKAFKTITSITPNANITGATFGTGNVLGLPFRIGSGYFIGAMFNDAVDAGTFVQADITIPATSSTGDVRGTYAPAGTLNGAKYLSVSLIVADPVSQVGNIGVTPA